MYKPAVVNGAINRQQNSQLWWIIVIIHKSLAISHCPLSHDYNLELIVQYTIRVTIRMTT